MPFKSVRVQSAARGAVSHRTDLIWVRRSTDGSRAKKSILMVCIGRNVLEKLLCGRKHAEMRADLLFDEDTDRFAVAVTPNGLSSITNPNKKQKEKNIVPTSVRFDVPTDPNLHPKIFGDNMAVKIAFSRDLEVRGDTAIFKFIPGDPESEVDEIPAPNDQNPSETE